VSSDGQGVFPGGGFNNSNYLADVIYRTNTSITPPVLSYNEWELIPDSTFVLNRTEDFSAYEMGTRFAVSLASQLYSVKFLRPTTSPAPAPPPARTWTVNVWDASATAIATATVSTLANRKGWIEAVLSSPVNLSTGVTYTVSYGVPTEAYYCATPAFFASAITPGGGNPLSAPTGAGVFSTSGPGNKPTAGFNNGYYYVKPVLRNPI
jgi:hypothetical protein